MFEEYINKYIRIVKKDNFSKYGLLLSVENGYLKLQYNDGKVEYVALDQVGSISEAPRRYS